MYVKATNGVLEKYPYSIGELRKDNPQTSFPKNPSAALLAEWNVFPVQSVDSPWVDNTQRFREGTPVYENGVWKQTWIIESLSQEEIEAQASQYNEQQKANRALAYASESDPIFFKWQRGEATQEDWLTAVEEIKLRYPYNL
jgi:hypothetical protein